MTEYCWNYFIGSFLTSSSPSTLHILRCHAHKRKSKKNFSGLCAQTALSIEIPNKKVSVCMCVLEPSFQMFHIIYPNTPYTSNTRTHVLRLFLFFSNPQSTWHIMGKYRSFFWKKNFSLQPNIINHHTIVNFEKNNWIKYLNAIESVKKIHKNASSKKNFFFWYSYLANAFSFLIISYIFFEILLVIVETIKRISFFKKCLVRKPEISYIRLFKWIFSSSV